MEIVAIVQARMGSTRLPGKSLKTVLGKPLLGYVIDRLKSSSKITKIVVATTTQQRDNSLVDFAKEENVEFFRGSEDDVLDRYAQAAVDANADVIIRITSDCPLIDPAIIDKGVQIFLDNHYDYVSNTLERTYPRGMDVEIFSINALNQATSLAKLPQEREHVTPYIINHPEVFSLKNFSYSKNFAFHRWTVDTEEDFALISKLIEIAYPTNPKFTLEDLLQISKEHPELQLLNSHIQQKKL